MGGWASNSKYPFLGALRSAAQMVSYEVSIGFVIITVLAVRRSLNSDRYRHEPATDRDLAGLPGSFLDWYWLPLLPMFVMFFISALAETNRPPFDLPEAESELVAGFMVEYSRPRTCCSCWVNMSRSPDVCHDDYPVSWRLAAASRCHCRFTWVPGVFWFCAKAVPGFLHVAMVKAFVPRYRYDQLMRLGLESVSADFAGWVVITAGVITAFGLAPRMKGKLIRCNSAQAAKSLFLQGICRRRFSCRCGISLRPRRR